MDPVPLTPCARCGRPPVAAGDSWSTHTLTCPGCGFSAGAYLEAWARRLWNEAQAERARKETPR